MLVSHHAWCETPPGIPVYGCVPCMTNTDRCTRRKAKRYKRWAWTAGERRGVVSNHPCSGCSAQRIHSSDFQRGGREVDLETHPPHTRCSSKGGRHRRRRRCVGTGSPAVMTISSVPTRTQQSGRVSLSELMRRTPLLPVYGHTASWNS
jgi:hypothetical protein